MSDFLGLMKQRLREEFEASLVPNPEQCPFTHEQIVHAYEQGYGVMMAYTESRKQMGIDVHHLSRWEYALRHAARNLSRYGSDEFLFDWGNSMRTHEERLKAFPLHKGYETIAKMLHIQPDEYLQRTMKDFTKWRKRQRLSWSDDPTPNAP